QQRLQTRLLLRACHHHRRRVTRKQSDHRLQRRCFRALRSAVRLRGLLLDQNHRRDACFQNFVRRLPPTYALQARRIVTLPPFILHFFAEFLLSAHHHELFPFAVIQFSHGVTHLPRLPWPWHLPGRQPSPFSFPTSPAPRRSIPPCGMVWPHEPGDADPETPACAARPCRR